MVKRAITELGVGIYTPSEAAFYARLRPQTLTQWIHGGTDRQPIVRAQFQGDSNKTISFLDFVQALAIRAIRNQYNIPTQRIAEGVRRAQEKYGVEYPLAKRHAIYLFSDRQREGHGQLVVQLENDLIQVSGPDKDSRLIQVVAELHLEDLYFNPDGLAARYVAFRREALEVTMDPHKRLGEPILPSGHTALGIFDAVSAEGGILPAARAYGIDPKEVELAVSYIDHLQAPL